MPVPEISTSPWHVVGFSPVVFTDTERVPGAVPFCWFTINQPVPHAAIEPAAVLVLVATDTVALVLVERVSVWAGGGVVPTWKPKESEVGVTLSAGVLVIVAVTETVVTELSEAVSVTVPEKGPACPVGN